MKVYYVEYRFGPDEWNVYSPHNDWESAQKQMQSLIYKAKSRVACSLDGYTEDDFRVVERIVWDYPPYYSRGAECLSTARKTVDI